MDSAEAGQWAAMLHAQEARVSRQEEFQAAMAAQLGQLVSQVRELGDRLQQPTQPPAAQEAPAAAVAPTQGTPMTGVGIKLASPERFSGEPGQCRAFLVDCSIHFEQLPQAFTTDRSKIAFMISHLAGRARAWATAEWARGSPLCFSFTDFRTALMRIFDPVSSDREKARELSRLTQGRDSVCDYAIRFRTLAVESGWDNTALYDIFLKGLATRIQELLLPVDLPADLDSLISLAIRTDNRVRELRQPQSSGSTTERYLRSPALGGQVPRYSPPEHCLPSSIAGEEEPMQIGRMRLTPEERRRRQQEGSCFYCGKTNHLVAACPAKRPQEVSQATDLARRSLTPVKVTHHATTIDFKALIDSGADVNLIDWGLAETLGLKSEPLVSPIKVRTLNGKELFRITHTTELLELQIQEHRELLNLYLFESPSQTLVLGNPWLCQHNPHVNWKTGTIMGWGEDCADHCKPVSIQGINMPSINHLSITSATDSETSDLSAVPPCYHHLREVFNKTKAMSLPPHRPYDCAIDLVSGSPIPKGRLYSISGPEKAAMKEYIESSLRTGLIRPSSSAAGAGFFL